MPWHEASGEHPDLGALQSLVDGETGPAGALHLARHLEGCARCREVRSRFERLAAALDALPAPDEPADFTAGVMRRVQQMPRPRPRRSLLRLVAPAAVLLAAVVGILALPTTGRVLRGFGRVLRPDLLEPSHLLDLLVGVAAAAAGLLGRAVEGLAPVAPSIPALHGPHAPLPAVLLAAALICGIAASTLLGLALAGGHILRQRAGRTR